MNIKKYDPKDVTVTIDSDNFGTFALTNFGEDDIECSADDDFAEATTGFQGDVILGVKASRLGTVTVPVQATCPQLKTVKRMANAVDVFGVWVVNKSTGEKTGGTKAYFKKTPDVAFGENLGDRSIEIQVLDYVDQ